MSQLIETLHRLVTPRVLEQVQHEAGSDTDKKDVLSALYVFLTSRLTDSQSLAHVQNLSTVDAQNGLSLLTAMNQNTPASQGFLSALKDAALDKLGMPHSTVDSLASVSLPLAYDEIKTLAGTQAIDSYLTPERDSLLASLPAWATAILPVSLFGATTAIPVNPLVQEEVVTQTVVTPEPATVGVLQKDKKEEGSFLKSLLPIIGALILAGLAWALMKGCQKEPAPVATPVTATEQTAVLAPATLSLSLNETGTALYACNGEMGNAGLGESIKNAVAGVFSADNCHFNVVNGIANDMPASQYVPQILGFMKGVPNATATIVDKKIVLNASDATALEKMVADIKGALPADFVVEAEPQLNVADAIKTSLVAAETALSGLTATSTADELVHALNLQIINFATDSAEIPEENKAILDKAAELIKQIPDAHLKITGHTDTQGSHAYNLDLSQKRAQSVHDYLVSKGVSDEKLEMQGASFDEPVATNATEQGRFRNRRIEFTVFKDGETIGKVGNATADMATVATDTAVAPTTTATDTTNAAANDVATGVAEVKDAVVDTATDVANATADTATDVADATKKAVN